MRNRIAIRRILATILQDVDDDLGSMVQPNFADLRDLLDAERAEDAVNVAETLREDLSIFHRPGVDDACAEAYRAVDFLIDDLRMGAALVDTTRPSDWANIEAPRTW